MPTIDDSVRVLYPEAKMGFLAVKNVSHSNFMTEEEFAELHNHLCLKTD